MIYDSDSDTFKREGVVLITMPEQYTLALFSDIDVAKSYICDLEKINKSPLKHAQASWILLPNLNLFKFD